MRSKFIFVLLCTFLSIKIFCQTANKCLESNNNNPSPPICPLDIASYYTPTTAVVYVKVNFWVTKPTSGPGIYDNNTITDANNYIGYFNTAFANLQPPNLNRSPNPPYYWNSKIQFVLNNFQFVTTPLYNDPDPLAPFAAQFRDENAINLIFVTHSNGGGKGVYANKQVVMYQSSPALGQGLGNVGLILHEIGHLFNLGHTVALDNLGNVMPAGSVPSGVPPTPTLVDDYWFEDLAYWDKYKVCDSLTSINSNNYMGYNFACRTYLSPKQLGYMHYQLSNERFCFVQNPSCVSDNSNINITSNTVYGTMHQPNGNITVKSGYKLTISGTVRMRENAKIIVEQGAKLIITSCGQLESSCGKLWDGIEVWGNSSQDQTINGTTGMPNYQGMVDIDGGTIKDAKTGIYLAKKVSGNPDLSTTGGIVHSINANYINNQVGADFYKYFTNSIITSEHGNRSYFKNDRFIFDKFYKGDVNNLPYAHIRGNEVANIKVYGCKFEGGNDDNNGPHASIISNPVNTYGIYAIDSRFIIKDFCQTPINATTCSGTPIQNSFNGFVTCIYLTNVVTTYASTIDHAAFTNDGHYQYGQIYANNIIGLQVINNEFRVNAYPAIALPNYGLYLNICDGYQIQNNSFTNSNNNYWSKTAGIYVNNSGTNPNSIYNNTFNYLKQPIWVTNVNYNSSNGVGLVMNCNDFTSSEYNIGVERSGRLCGTCVNNVGVATTQGIYNLGNDLTSVRNKYNTPSCVTNAENKYYINTSNSFAITTHGSFNGSQWHPTPQTNASCSNALELIDVVGSNFPNNPNKSIYCPVSNTSTFGSKLIPGSLLAAHRANKKAFSDSLSILSGPGKQNENKTSKYNSLKAQLELVEREIGLIHHTAIQEYLNADNGTQYDSILSILSTGELPQAKFTRVGVLIASKNHSVAQTAINALRAENSAYNTFCDLQELALSLSQDPAALNNLKGDQSVKNQLLLEANKADFLTEGLSIALLAKIYNIQFAEERMEPSSQSTASKLLNSEVNGSILLSDNIRMYPNPAKDQLFIESSDEENSEIQLTDLTGKVILKEICTKNCTISLNTLQNGIYLVNLYKQNSLISTKKIVVIK